MRIFIQLSKFGDVFSILPILKRESELSGKPAKLLISKEYAEAVSGSDYVEPIIYGGHWSDLRGAIKWAKKSFDDVVVLQTHGKDFPIQHRTPSFQIEQFRRAGCVELFDTLPMVINKRNLQRERLLLGKTVERQQKAGRPYEKFILLADESESSPFPNKSDLFDLVKAANGGLKIVMLSEVKAESVIDLLGLYDRAECLITVETSHIHLSAASKVPTIALAADGWRGSAFSHRFVYYARYGEYERIKGNLADAVKSAIAGDKGLSVATVPTDHRNGYNLSISGNTMTYRYHDKGWKTKLAIANNGQTFELQTDESLADYSIEDARLFELGGKLHAAYTVATAINGFFRCYQAYGEITNADGEWRLGHIQPKYKGNDFSGMNKNWCPIVKDGVLYFIHGIRGDKQIAIQMNGAEVAFEFTCAAPTWAYGEIRGGAVVQDGDSMIRFFHSRSDYDEKAFRYFIGASIIENKPPFRATAISKKPIMAGDERYTPNCSHWKPSVSIVYGAKKEGDKISISIGQNDSRCAIVELTKEQLGL